MTSRRPVRRTSSIAAALTASLLGLGAVSAGTPAAEAAPQPGDTPRHSVPLPAGIQPEGVTSVGRTYFAGSMQNGRIVTGDLFRGKSRVLLPGATGRQLRGLYYDRTTRLIWAAGNVGEVAHVYAVDSRTGKLVSDTLVPGGLFLNDLVVTQRGVWVTDSMNDRLTLIPVDAKGRPTGGTPTFRTLTGDWPATAEFTDLRANGIRRLDGQHLLLDHSTSGGLYSVDVSTGVAREIVVPGGPRVESGDGIERSGTTLWVVRGNSDTTITQLELVKAPKRPSGYVARFVRLLDDKTFDVPTTATYTRGRLYAVNARFGNPSPTTATYSITRVRNSAASRS